MVQLTEKVEGVEAFGGVYNASNQAFMESKRVSATPQKLSEFNDSRDITLRFLRLNSGIREEV